MKLVRWFMICLSLVVPWLAGCAAFCPMDGLPARYLPDDLKVGHRNGKKTIDLSLLSQRWNGIYLVDSGDLLAIYIGGLLGKMDENPPVQLPQNADYQPAAGFPVTVREDGTISLPMIKPLSVRGMTIREVEEAIRTAYTNHEEGKEFLPPGHERILVSLQRPRQTHVMVVRQDSRGEPLANAAVGLLNIGTVKRGTGKVVSLPAYRNDVLNALVATDGLPGLDAENAVYIIRRQVNGKDLNADPNWLSNPDPAELIRQSKEKSSSAIRGQNQDQWDLRNSSYDRSVNAYGEPKTDFGQSSQLNSSPVAFPDRTRVPGWGDQPMGFDQRQSPFSSQRNGDQAPFSQQQQSQGNPFPTNVDRTGYQYPSYVPMQPRPSASSPFPNNGNPNPLNGGPTPIANPSQQGQPSYNGPISQPAIPNAAGSSNGIPPSPNGNIENGNIPFGPPGLQGPGYSIPDDQGGYIGNQDDIDEGALPFDQQYSNGGGQGMGVGLVDGRRIIRIPIRLGPDEHVDIKKEDVILHEGDIVFIESRDTEVFFTGGLLGGGQYTLPRDFDLDILQALSIATSRQGGGAARQVGGVSALNSDVTISPSNVVIIRKLPEGGEIPIKIDLYRARSDLSERLIIQPGDYIYLQYTPLEAIGAFIDRHLLEGALFGVFSTQLNNKGN